MESIAALVTIAQLTEYIVRIIASIHKICVRLRLRSERLWQHLRQIERLGAVIASIESNESFSQSAQPRVSEHLRAIAQTVCLIKDTLDSEFHQQEKKPFVRALKTCINKAKQDRLDYLFNQLEADKTSLILSISEVHMGLADKIWQSLLELSRHFTGASDPPMADNSSQVRDKVTSAPTSPEPTSYNSMVPARRQDRKLSSLPQNSDTYYTDANSGSGCVYNAQRGFERESSGGIGGTSCDTSRADHYTSSNHRNEGERHFGRLGGKSDGSTYTEHGGSTAPKGKSHFGPDNTHS